MDNGKALVTGAGGFIGSHLTETLACRGWSVRALVHYNALNSWGWLDRVSPDIRSRIEVVTGDVRDPGQTRELVRDRDVVFHLAALIAIPFSYQAPDSYIDTNVKGTLNILRAARDMGVGRVVHTSTSEVYGTARFVPITEEHPIAPQSPYAASKSGADHMAQAFHLSFGLPVATVRPFNVYGPRQSARAVIPTIITQALSGKRRIRLGATRPTRDFTFVEDTVEGFIAAATAANAPGQVINVGSNFEIPIGDVVGLVGEVIGETLEVEADDVRLRPTSSEVERLWAANAKARDVLGWTPAHGGREGFARGLARTVAWFREGGNLDRYKSDLYNV